MLDLGCGGGHVAFAAAAKMSASTAGYEAPSLDFEPAKQTVTAQVDARFTMTAPHFGT